MPVSERPPTPCDYAEGRRFAFNFIAAQVYQLIHLLKIKNRLRIIAGGSLFAALVYSVMRAVPVLAIAAAFMYLSGMAKLFHPPAAFKTCNGVPLRASKVAQ